MLAALCLALYLPGMTTIPVLDRDEARFAQATRQMLETGDFLHISFRDEPRNQKPASLQSRMLRRGHHCAFNPRQKHSYAPTSESLSP